MTLSVSLAGGIQIKECFALQKPALPKFLPGYANLTDDQIRHGILG